MPALRSIRWAIAHSPAAESSSSGSRSPWYGRSSKAPPSIASRIWRSTRLSQLCAVCGRPSASRRCGLMARCVARPRQASCHGPLLRFGRATLPRRHDRRQCDGPGRLSRLRPPRRRSSSVGWKVSGNDRIAARTSTVQLMQDRGRCPRAGPPRATARLRQADRRDREGGPDDPGRLRRRRGRDARGDARRRGRHLPGDVLRRPMARPRRLPLHSGRAPERLGSAWSYDIADTKLARGGQGLGDPPDVRVRRPAGAAPGHPPRVRLRRHRRRGRAPHRLADYARLLPLRQGPLRGAGRSRDLRGPTTYPDPVDHCRVCVWYPTCITRRRTDDHLSIVAGMRRVDTERLMADGRHDGRALARRSQPIAPSPDMRSPALLEAPRTRHGSSSSNATPGQRVFELIEPHPTILAAGSPRCRSRRRSTSSSTSRRIRGRSTTGSSTCSGSSWSTTRAPSNTSPLWGHDRAGEKAAFEQLIDLVIARLDAHPEMHLYHYGGYESGAIKRLMQRHATRRGRGRPAAPRRTSSSTCSTSCARASARRSSRTRSSRSRSSTCPSARARSPKPASASSSTNAGCANSDQSILDDIAAYNRDDCVSTLLLRDWLEDRRAEAIDEFPERRLDAADRRATGCRPKRQSARMAEVQVRVDALMAGLPADRRERARRGSRPAGCWPASSTGTAATRSPPGGSGTTSGRSRSTT